MVTANVDLTLGLGVHHPEVSSDQRWEMVFNLW